MQFPIEFPPDARIRVDIERMRACAALEQEARAVERGRRGSLFLGCVMRIFLAFAREACAIAKEGDLPAWCGDELEVKCDEFLLSIVMQVWEDKAKDLGIARIFSSPYHWGCALDEDALRKIKSTPEWNEYQDLLVNTRKFQAARAGDSIVQPQEGAGRTLPTRTASPVIETAPRVGPSRRRLHNSPALPHATKDRAARRRAVVTPILVRKRWTSGRLLTESGVGKATLYGYLDGTRKSIKTDNRQAIADALELPIDQLPS